jgi:outer membrane protein OmpA-like peptidoglycan-associated protein
MKTIISFAINPRLGLAFAAIGAALAGCSTVKDISPFSSNVPYAQDISPTMARPASPEIPVYKAAPAAAPAIKPAPVPSPPPPPQPAPSPQSSIAPTPSPVAMAAAPAPVEKTVVAQKAGEIQSPSPSPEEKHTFKDDGTYPNLAQVPARPVNMPTFLEAAAVEKSLVGDRDNAKDAVPDSPASPAVDSVTSPASVAVAQATATPLKTTTIAARIEDGSPCLSQKTVDADPTAILRFEIGSSSLTSDDLQILADSLPAVRQSKGAIRILGHGDTEPGAAQAAGRFDLAASRAGAVAQALAGFGIPAPRIALGVACTDASMAGASVQLYTSES